MVRILGVLPVPNLAKAIAAASGTSTASGGLNIEDVFSTYLYEGNGSTQTITNGIDLAGEGGMVWIKDRGNANSNLIHDTERGLDKIIRSNTTYAEATNPAGKDVTAFNSDGFTLGENYNGTNYSGFNYVSWTFRKAPRFFDVVTYTGDGTSNRNIAHDLGVAPGMIVCKRLDGSDNWGVWHTSEGADGGYLNATNSFGVTLVATGHDDANFVVSSGYGINNANGAEYVAYLYAHDPLGPSGDGSDGLIACGEYDTDGSGVGNEVDLGWEPQYLLVKGTDVNSEWKIMDTMRGLNAIETSGAVDLQANSSNAEAATSFFITATGFKDNGSFAANKNFIYMAIRRPMAVPESGDEVFAVGHSGADGDVPDGYQFHSGWPVDFAIQSVTTGSNHLTGARLTGNQGMKTNATDAEEPAYADAFGHMLGWRDWGGAEYPTYYAHMFKRAPQFFDVVCYEGDGLAGREVAHNLTVVPEMMIVKSRTSGSEHWTVYHSALTATSAIWLNLTNDKLVSSTRWNDTEPTDSVFTLGTQGQVNASGNSFIALLFATLAGVSKVGSYTGNGSNQTIDCGFSAGARFILIKRTEIVSSGDWFMWDSERGIVAGTDPHLSLNTTTAEVTSDDSVDPDNSGFIVNQVSATNINVTSAEYIFLAIA
jgi:hypothetical protein